MPKTGISLSPQGPGMLAFRHRDFDSDSPNWDLDKRAAILGFEITGRDDNQQPNSIGHWKEDPDTRGDLNLANYWQAKYDERPVGMWHFGAASLISSSAGGKPAANTTGGAGDVTQTAPSGGSIEVLPVGKGAAPDTRFKPKNPMTLQPEGGADGDPDSPNAQGAHGEAGAAGEAGGAGAEGNNVVDLGNGWFYQDGAIAYLGPSRGGVDSLSGFNGGYHGGGLGFGFNPLEGTGIGGLSAGQHLGASFSFGGNGSTASLTGIAGIGFGSGFAQFGGVRNFFGGSGSGGRVGATFQYGPGQRR